MTQQRPAGMKKRTATDSNRSGSPDASSFPSSPVRSIVTVALLAHGFLLLVAYGSIVEPSDIQLRLGRFFSWYLQPLHLSIDGRPVYLVHEPIEAAAVQFQIRSLPTGPSGDPTSETGWQPVPATGWAGGEQRKRYRRWASTTAALAQQQESGVAGLLARAAVTDESVRAVRLVALPNRLLDQQPQFEAERYRAAIVREGESLRFVQLSEPRQNAVAVDAAAAADRRSPSESDEQRPASSPSETGASRRSPAEDRR